MRWPLAPGRCLRTSRPRLVATLVGTALLVIGLARPASVAADCPIDDPACLELTPPAAAPGATVSGGFGALGWSEGSVGDRCGSTATLTFFTGPLESATIAGEAEVAIAEDWTGTFRVPAVAAGEYSLAISCPPVLEPYALAVTFTVLPGPPDTSTADETSPDAVGIPLVGGLVVLWAAAIILGIRGMARSRP